MIRKSSMLRVLLVAVFFQSLNAAYGETPGEGVSKAPPTKDFSTTKKILISAGIGSLIIEASLLDRTLRHHLFTESTTASAKKFRQYGDVGQFSGPIIGTIFGVDGLITDNEKSKKTALLSYEAFLWSGGISGALKFSIGRKRPSATDNPYHFQPNFKDSSFPSGHTTVAFAAATIFTEQYPSWWVGVPAYGAASAVGFSRMYANQHWFSDVLAGATLGIVVAHTVRKNSLHKKTTQSEWQIGPGSLRWVQKF